MAKSLNKRLSELEMKVEARREPRDRFAFDLCRLTPEEQERYVQLSRIQADARTREQGCEWATLSLRGMGLSRR
jgi:hypothetical protein